MAKADVKKANNPAVTTRALSTAGTKKRKRQSEGSESPRERSSLDMAKSPAIKTEESHIGQQEPLTATPPFITKQDVQQPPVFSPINSQTTLLPAVAKQPTTNVHPTQAAAARFPLPASLHAQPPLVRNTCIKCLEKLARLYSLDDIPLCTRSSAWSNCQACDNRRCVAVSTCIISYILF